MPTPEATLNINVRVPGGAAGGIEGFVHRLFNDCESALRGVAKDEQAELEAAISKPVGRDFAGNVTERSKPGEPPRLETGELAGNVESVVVRSGPAEVVMAIGVSKPDKPEVPVELEYGGPNNAPRPFVTPSMHRAADKALAALTKAAQNAK
jgi:hypothetical protein